MRETITLRDVMTREFVGVNESDALSGAVDLLIAEDAICAVVLRGRDPVGTLSERDVLSHLADGGTLDDATVADAMSDPPTVLPPDASTTDAAAALAKSDVRGAVVVDGADDRGVVTVRDLLPAGTTSGPEEEAIPETDVTAREGVADDQYAEQSICEACGSLARQLSTFNGQALCADCLDV